MSSSKYPKSTATLFITWTVDMRLSLNIQVEGFLIPNTKYPNVLGFSFDSLLQIDGHITAIYDKI